MRFIIISFILLLFPYNLYSMEILKIEKNDKRYDLGNYISIYVDNEATLTIDDVRRPEFDKNFTPSDELVPNLGFTKSALWIKFSVINNDISKKWLLRVLYPLLDYITLYTPNSENNNTYTTKISGEMEPFTQRDILNRNIIFELPSQSGIITYYLRCKSDSPLSVPLELISQDHFINVDHNEQFVLGLFYGIIILMFIFNLLQLLFNRDKAYLYYIFYLIGIFFFNLTYNGLAYEYILTSHTWLSNQAFPFFMAYNVFWIILFVRQFLKTDEYTPRLDIYFKGLTIFSGILMVCNFFLSYTVASICGTVLSSLTIMVLPAGIICMFKGFRPARFFVLAWASFALFVLITSLRAFGVIHQNFITIHGIQIGSVLEATLLSLALFDRYNIVKREREEILKKTMELQRQTNEELEKKVLVRTHELSQANEDLQKLDKMKSNFFTNISHEIRTPLTLILSPVESILQGDSTIKANTEFFQSIQRNAIRLLKLINNLLDFAKLESGHMKMVVEEADIVKILHSYIGTVYSAAESRRINMNIISLNEKVILYLDLDKIDKIAMNIFSNALKFTDKGGEIIVKIKDDDKNCYILVQDSGIGIPDNQLNSIFDRFTQVDTSNTLNYEGTGIGLALTKELVEMHGGSIKVESKCIDIYPDDHGTTFTITIPKGKVFFENRIDVDFIIHSELQDSISNQRFDISGRMNELKLIEENNPSGIITIDNPLKKPTILLVDDNIDMRNFLKSLLYENYNVITAINGEDGIIKTRESNPDLIITDVMMPIMNGYDMTRLIKEDLVLKLIPILMITAKAEIAHKIEGLEYGADDYLTKPFNSKELLTRIKSLLKIKEMQNELYNLNINLTTQVEEQLALLIKSDELKRYLPPQLVDSILKGEKHVTFENERKKLTIFFSDIKGFTDTTDSMEAEELSSLLNEYLTEMTKIAHLYGGTIDKFIGDAIMIFFGAPESTTEKDQAVRCVKMAIDMQHKMKELKEKWFRSGIEYPLEIRIGINTGTATVGNFGAEDRLSYTVIGGQVNLASRLENLANPGGILISHSTWAQIEEEIPCKKRGKVQVKGISREILVYDVLID